MAYEDFTTYTEVDVEGRSTVTSTRVTVTGMERDDTCVVYKDFGAGFFGNFEHSLAGLFDTFTGVFGYMTLWSVGNSLAPTGAVQYASNVGIQALFSAGNSAPAIVFEENAGDTTDNMLVSLDTVYYLEIERNSAISTTSHFCRIYSNPSRTNLLDTLTNGYASTTYQYLGTSGSRASTPVDNDTITAYIENMDLSGAGTTRFRRTLSSLGTRTGVRQVIGV